MYGSNRTDLGTDQSLPESTKRQSDAVETYAVGTLFSTADGPVPIEQLRVGDQVIDDSGYVRAVLWLREDRQTAMDARAGRVYTDTGRQTRFPGVRFVRGRRADMAYQIILGDVQPVTPFVPSQQSQQPQPEYVAAFSSSRTRSQDDDDGDATPLAAE
jgi:hypothetical protein